MFTRLPQFCGRFSNAAAVEVSWNTSFEWSATKQRDAVHKQPYGKRRTRFPRN
jgi:hypothetical protein